MTDIASREIIHYLRDMHDGLYFSLRMVSIDIGEVIRIGSFLTSRNRNIISIEYFRTTEKGDLTLKVVVDLDSQWRPNLYRHPQTAGVFLIRTVTGSGLKHAVFIDV